MANKPTVVYFGQGIQKPAKLGTAIQKLAAKGSFAYAQNVDSQNDEYGNGAITPGPAQTSVTNNSQLTGVPFIYAKLSSVLAGFEFVIFFEGLLGATNKIRTLLGFKDGGTPSISTGASASKTVPHNDASHNDTGHTGIVIEDVAAIGDILVIVGYDNTDVFVMQWDIDSTGSDLSLDFTKLIQMTTLGGDRIKVHHVIRATDGSFYLNKTAYPTNTLVRILSDLTTVTSPVLTLPPEHYVTCFQNFRKNLLVAWTPTGQGEFTNRTVGGKSGVLIWNLTDPSYTDDYECPANYISAMVQIPDGNLLVFGGVNEGRSTLYEFTGFGFRELVSYIGDLPRSKYAVDFDEQGRVIWITADGQVCRYDLVHDVFDHLYTVPTASDAGGILTKFNDIADFIASGGSGSTYLMKKIVFGTYAGDGAAAVDDTTTPVAFSGLQVLPPKSSITAITLNLAKSLVSGEKVEVRIYKNGSTTYDVYMTLDFSVDGSVSSKREAKTMPEINSYTLAVAWKMADGSATVPPVVSALVEDSSIYG